MHPYPSPVNPKEIVDIVPVDIVRLVADVGKVAPPEIYQELVKTLSNPEGELLENPLHPENELRQNEYHDRIWRILVRGYLIKGVSIRWTDKNKEEVAKIRDILGDEAKESSNHTIYLENVFTDPTKPQQLSDLAVAIQGVTFLDREGAGNLARMFRTTEGWQECLRFANIAGRSANIKRGLGVFV